MKRFRLVLALSLIAWATFACRAAPPLDAAQLFADFVYRGSYVGVISDLPEQLTAGPAPSRYANDVIYVYEPQQAGRFTRLGRGVFPQRLRQQGWQIVSAPGVNDGNFFAADRNTFVFVILFERGDCSGSLAGQHKITGDELYLVRLRDGC